MAVQLLGVQLVLPQVPKLAPLQSLQRQAVDQEEQEAVRLEVAPVEAHLEAVPAALAALAVQDRQVVATRALQPLARTKVVLLVPSKAAVRVRSLPEDRGLVQLVHPAARARVFARLARERLQVPVPPGALAVQIHRADRRWAVPDLLHDEELRQGYDAESHEGEPWERKVRAQDAQQDRQPDKSKESSMNQLASKATITEA